MSIESKNLSFGDTAFTSDIPAIKSGWFHIWFSKLAVSVCVCMILELVLHLALPGSFLRNEELSLQVRLFLLSRTWVALTLWGLAIGGVLTLSARGLDYFAPANGYLRKLMQHALGFVFGLIVLLYVISWAVYWQLSKFLDRHSISFFAAQPLQVFHWVDADVALAVILIASPVTLLIGRWIPRWVEGKSPMAQRILSRIFCGVIGASCLWSLFGTLIIHKQDQRFIQGFIAEGLDQQMSPFVRALSDFRDYLNPGPGDFGVIETADPPPRPIVSMDQYLATVDRRKIRSWNVIVLTVESLRADILRAYGSTRDVMPTADALARDARVFVNAYAQASHTSYAALAPLSSHYPLRSTMQYTYPESMTYPRVLIYDVPEGSWISYRHLLIIKRELGRHDPLPANEKYRQTVPR